MKLTDEIIEIGRNLSFDEITTTNLLLNVDRLTAKELEDLEYVEDRLETHYEVYNRDVE